MDTFVLEIIDPQTTIVEVETSYIENVIILVICFGRILILIVV
jgi:hypothetical protein